MFLFIPYLIMELYFSLYTGEEIGFFWSLIWIISSASIGMILLQNSSQAIMGQFQSVKSGKLNMKKFQDASMSYFIAAILLIIPGVLSDFMGIVALAYTVYLHFLAKITPEQTNFNIQKGDNDVIDVEIIDEHTNSNNRS